MNIRINLTQSEFERAIRKYDPLLRLEHTFYPTFEGTKEFKVRKQKLHSGLYYGNQYLGAIPAIEFYLFDRLEKDGTIKQIGLMYTAKRLAKFVNKRGLRQYEQLLDDLKLSGWAKAFLLTIVTKNFIFGITREEFIKNKDSYHMHKL